MITNDSQMTGAIGESLVVAELIKKGWGAIIDLTYLIYKEGYPPQWNQEVSQKVLEQVENYKNHE